jgi:diguanylate cyclase (GGDEF)-like protein
MHLHFTDTRQLPLAEPGPTAMPVRSSQALDARVEQYCLRAEANADAASPDFTPEDATDAAFKLLVQASVLIRAGRGHEALETARHAVEAARAQGDALIELHGTLAVAKALTVCGNLPSALFHFQSGLHRARENGDRYTEGMFLVNLGFYHGRVGEAEAYEEYTRLALERFRAFKNPRAVAHTLNNLAGAVAWQGRYDEALSTYAEALEQARALDWKRGQALILAGIGGVLLRTDRIEAGTHQYLQSLTVAQDVGDAFMVTRHYLLLGEALVGAQRPAEAIPYLQEAVTGAEAGGFDVELSSAWEHISRAQEALGQLGPALHALRRHIEVERSAGLRRGEEQVERLTLEHRLSTAKLEADARAVRNRELETLNNALTEAFERQQAMQAELERLAHHDMLTGLYNRRFLSELAGTERARTIRSGSTFAVLLLDVDHFKDINDAYGHAVGDAVLIGLGQRLRRLLRSADLVGRWGGEEFAALAVDVDAEGAARTAERLCRGIAAEPFATEAGPVSVTLSCGVAVFRSASDELYHLMALADKALYAAKDAGRNGWKMAG